MSSLSVMEWIAKHPLQGEWENLVASGTNATENIKMWQATEWGIEAEEGMDSGSLYRGGCASVGTSGGTSFDPGYACMSKSSKSASMNSSSTEEMNFPNLSVKDSEVYPGDLSNKRDLASVELPGASPTVDSSICSGEPVLSLKLGKQTYFEQMSDRSNPRASNPPSVAKSSNVSAKRLKPNSQNMSAPCCQVEGCNIDLSSAKSYHRKHRVCESHSKSPKVVVNGVERRFCQQCSRFHGLSDFDENKRSCRKRLSDHNARRRKPHPNHAHFNPARLSTIIYSNVLSLEDEICGLQQINSIYSEVPVEHTKSSVNSMWSNTSNLKFLQTKGDALKPAGKPGGIDGNLHVLQGNKLPNTVTPVTVISYGSSELQPVKGTTVKILGGGSEESLLSSSRLGASQDLHRALSLLSTNSRDSCKQSKPLLHDMNNTSISKLWTSGVPQALSSPLCSTEYWNMEQWPSSSLRHELTPQSSGSSKGLGSSNFPEFMLPPEGEHEFLFESVHLS